ncbi:MAG: hypothetical protein RR521_10830 [Clostridia bacterium]
MPSMEYFRRFAGADPDSDVQVLGGCLSAAAAWYAKAGIPMRDGDELYDFWVCNLGAWMYDNRGAGGDGANIPPYIVYSVHQLRKRRTAPPVPRMERGAGET